MYIYGRNAVFEAMTSEAPIEKIFIQFSAEGAAIENIKKFAKREKIVCAVMDNKKFIDLEKQVVEKGERTQGVIALRQMYKGVALEEFIADCDMTTNPVVVILDEISDPHNFGAIVRSVECSGAVAVIRPLRNSAPVTPVVLKTSSGALENISLITVGNLSQAIDQLKAAGFWIFGTDTDANKNYSDNLYQCPVALIIGSEGKGMRPAVRKNCDVIVKIPMAGKTESLNASVSAGILLFEIARQRSINKA